MDAGPIHFLAGAAGGTAGAVITCPLEVVKTRLQSSNSGPRFPISPSPSLIPPSSASPAYITGNFAYGTTSPICAARNVFVAGGDVATAGAIVLRRSHQQRFGLIQYLRQIIQTEGPMALFKGLGPNIVGVAPSRAIYFWAYSQSKSVLNQSGLLQPDSPLVHVLAGATAGFSSSTFTNPIWFIKTRLQLDQRANSKLNAWQCMRQIYTQHGILGFYKGISASYYGLSETMIHFVVYEQMKILLRDAQGRRLEDDEDDRSVWQFFEYMAAGATSKTVATCVAYPHEVARTRLREEGSRYKTFWQTIGLVYREDGIRGLYRGLATQLVRQIPNTAIMMATYEAVVYIYYKQTAEYS